MLKRVAFRALLGVSLLSFASGVAAQDPVRDPSAQLHGPDSAGASVYRETCAVCHDSPGGGRAPARIVGLF